MGGFVRQLLKKKSVQQAFKPKEPKIEAPKGPTKGEIDDIKKLSNKRRGRKATMLTGASGLEDEVYLSKKSMLG